MSNISLNSKDILSVKDVQTILCIGRSLTYELLTSNKIRSKRIGTRIIVPRVYLEEFLNKENEE